jgi:DNA-binding winged helix-turn-helix (wHTH) protein
MNGRAGDRAFDFGAWRVVPARGVLIPQGGGDEVRIEPRLMDLLMLFAASSGAVIGKDEIIASVWEGRAIGDDTLAAAVSRLRSALGAMPANRYIETAPKRGCRLAPSLTAEAAPGRTAQKADLSEAARLVAQGRAALWSGSPIGLPQARLYFEAAIRAEPKRADAQAGLAEALFAQHLAGYDSPAELLSGARAAAHAAVGLDETLAGGWTALGYATLLVERDFAGADEAFRRAISLDPAATGALRYRAFALLAVGRMVDAEREARKAVALEPLSLAVRGGLLQTLLAGRRYRQVIAEAKAMLALSAQASEAWYGMGWALVLLGEEADGVDALLQGLAMWGVDEGNIERLRQIYAADGFAGLCAAGADLFESQQVMFTARPTDVALLRAFAGQTDRAFAALEAAAARQDPYLLLLSVLPWFDRLNNDPRWRPLIERSRLVR